MKTARVIHEHGSHKWIAIVLDPNPSIRANQSMKRRTWSASSGADWRIDTRQGGQGNFAAKFPINNFNVRITR
jgi:hypothetical protein